MSARNALGQFAFPAEVMARRYAIIRHQAAQATQHGGLGAVARQARRWGVPMPAVLLPEVAPGVFANTTDPAFTKALFNFEEMS